MHLPQSKSIANGLSDTFALPFLLKSQMCRTSATLLICGRYMYNVQMILSLLIDFYCILLLMICPIQIVRKAVTKILRIRKKFVGFKKLYANIGCPETINGCSVPIKSLTPPQLQNDGSYSHESGI
ncbi:hypothetical protein AVEN_141575-1 [Araneus ventricosus]|uniref:Transmembrane protein n=1 Tax=Araneus ventricosus TaxID=182803 RepID=A0A4Y2UTN8_ARAVE|nr:hypothetical protein AVEN_141575-1 [Araneus ventricosus]